MSGGEADGVAVAGEPAGMAAFVPEEKVVGAAVAIVSPWDRLSTFTMPSSFSMVPRPKSPLQESQRSLKPISADNGPTSTVAIAKGWLFDRRHRRFITNTPTGQLQFFGGQHCAHARVEDRIRHAKTTGLDRFPSRKVAINQAWETWLAMTMIAADLGARIRLLALKDSVLAKAEPKALRHRMLYVPASLAHGARRRRLKMPEAWPWVHDIVIAFARVAALP